MTQTYLPVIWEVPEPKDVNTLVKSDHGTNSIIFAPHISYPKSSLGFQHFIHQSKINMEITKNFKGKKVYYVMSQFEKDVDDYDQDLEHLSVKYFDLSNKPRILSRAFYKLWEMFFLFDLIDLGQKNFVSAHLAEGPGSFIQATMFYRDKFGDKGISKNDQYYAVTLHAENFQKHIPTLADEFVTYYSKEKPVRFIMHKTYPLKEASMSKTKDNGDLTSKKTRDMFGGHFAGQKAHLVTADGGFEWKDENLQEQEAYLLILAQIVTALKIQAPKGNFVCKIYESFTEITIKFILILRVFYDKVFICKPLMSRASNSEKYLVCMGFKESSQNSGFIKIVENILDQMASNPNYPIDIFPSYEFSRDDRITMIRANTSVSNRQFIEINDIISFVKKQNFRGEEYMTRRDMQIEATKYWNQMFFPSVNEFANKRKECKKITHDVLESKKVKSETSE